MFVAVLNVLSRKADSFFHAMIQFFNTLSGKAGEFKPLKEGPVSMYTCGPTVYDYAHIGNFRAFVFEDLLRRFLEFSGYKVTHVMNLTDVDDKTIAGARKEGKKLEDYTAQYIEAFNEDLKTLNCLPPTKQPRATRKIKPMQELIQKLIGKGMAYENAGSVYYRVSKFKGYGKLSKKKLEMNIAGASERVDSDEYESKEQVTDFVLWKGAKEGETELGAAWDSPWGKGRPGWHIECSAMSMEELGEQFDIHAGGEDLIFPHHENEIAQSEGATGKDPFVKYWLHCKFLLVNGEKMSKSKGNFYTLRDLLAKGYDPIAIRYALLSTHYRSPLNFTLEGVEEAEEVIKRLDDCYYRCLSVAALNENREVSLASKEDFEAQAFLVSRLKNIVEALQNDLNISVAFANLFEAVKGINLWFPDAVALNTKDLKGAIYFFKCIDYLFGFDVAEDTLIPRTVMEMLKERITLRRQKEFVRADEIRDRIKREARWFVKDPRPGEPSTVRRIKRAWE